MIDLAGSERLSLSMVEGKTFKLNQRWKIKRNISNK
jgi:hypothetical protein